MRHTLIVPRGLRLSTRYVVELPLLSRNLLHKKITGENWISLVVFTQRVYKQAAPKPQRPRIKNINRRMEGGRKITVCIILHISGQTAVCLVI